MRHNGFYFLDVLKDARKLLVVRSFLYGFGMFCFVHSLRFVSPVTALCAQGTTVVMNTCLVRLPRAFSRSQEFGFILPTFTIATFILMISLGLFSEFDIDIVASRNKSF